ncbi:MAG TPA: RluA family pseudouridine synthase [Candidatus Eisenbacteria bacterium]|jgi:23S rRNA pseudouridine1911/1915/1917 synthase
MLELVVPAPQAGERLDRYLAGAQAELSRSRLQALIREGRVRVNGRAARASLRLQGGDQVHVDLPPPRVSALVPEDIPLAIVYEDESLLVVNKPPGMVVHPGAGVRSGTLVHALLHHDSGIAGVGGAERPGIVHRLDRDTSGLMVVARGAQAYRALIEAIKNREVRRRYLGLAWGNPRAEAGVIEAPIGRDPRHRQRMAVVARGGKPARTRWRVTERFGACSALELDLDTGRTHQIRVHLAHAGHPVVGDGVYGGRSRMRLSASPAERSVVEALLDMLPRQALHASELEFAHPVSAVRLRFEAPLPADLAAALGWLEEHREQRRG